MLLPPPMAHDDFDLLFPGQVCRAIDGHGTRIGLDFVKDHHLETGLPQTFDDGGGNARFHDPGIGYHQDVVTRVLSHGLGRPKRYTIAVIDPGGKQELKGFQQAVRLIFC